MIKKFKEKSMIDKINEENACNICHIAGRVLEQPVFDYAIESKEFYKIKVAVKRPTGYFDVIPVTVPKYFLSAIEGCDFVDITGKLRTFRYADKKGEYHRDTVVFAKILNQGEVDVYDNDVSLIGFVVRKDGLRPFRDNGSITTFCIAENSKVDYENGRTSKISNYVNCVSLNKIAQHFDKHVQLGDQGIIAGALHSRSFSKTNADGTVTNRTVCEVMCKHTIIYKDLDQETILKYIKDKVEIDNCREDAGKDNR